MIRHRRLQRSMPVLLFAALLVGPLTGAHLQLCLDGAEPPAGYLFDVGQCQGRIPQGHGRGGVDVRALGELIAKGKGEGQLPRSTA